MAPKSPNSPVCIQQKQLPFTDEHPIYLLEIQITNFSSFKWDLTVEDTHKMEDTNFGLNLLFHWNKYVNRTHELITQCVWPFLNHSNNTGASPKLTITQLWKIFWADTPSYPKDNLLNLKPKSAFPVFGLHSFIVGAPDFLSSLYFTHNPTVSILIPNSRIRG